MLMITTFCAMFCLAREIRHRHVLVAEGVAADAPVLATGASSGGAFMGALIVYYVISCYGMNMLHYSISYHIVCCTITQY